MFRKIRKAENAIEIDEDSITDFTEFFDGINKYYVFTFNDQKVIFAPHGLFPSSKNLAEVDVYIGSAFSKVDKLCVLKNKNYIFRGELNQKLDILKLAPEIEIFFIDLAGNNVSEDLVKSKIYLKPQEKPPKGYEVKRGPKGGLYYESHVEIALTPVLEFKKFPSELRNLPQLQTLYETLLESKSFESQLRQAYDMWTWFKEHKGSISPDGQRIFNNFHRLINKKIRTKLKADFDAHVGKPKISSTAMKIKTKLKSELHEEVKTASEAFIASIVPEGMRVEIDPGQIKDWQENVVELAAKYGLHDLSVKFREMSNEKNARAFLLKSENLLKDLDTIDNSEVVEDMNWRITRIRKDVLNILNWEKIYQNLMMKNRTNEEDAHKMAQSISIFTDIDPKIRDKTIDEVREMLQETIMKLSPEVLKRIDFGNFSIRAVDNARGYMATTRRGILIDKTFFPKRGSARTNENSFKSAITHELAHVYEDNSPEFVQAEQALFRRRTEFCNIANSRAWGNSYNTYKDRWRDSYAGRVYNDINFEITSTTIGEMRNEYDFQYVYAEDPEMFMFAKEALLDGKLEK